MRPKLEYLARWYLPIILLLAALPRLGLAWLEHGLNQPDEIFQTLEAAHRWVYGYGIQAWEFQDGARSWLLPGLIALPWKGLVLLGITDPLVVVPLLRLPFVALAVYAAMGASRLARTLAGEMAGNLAALLAAFCPLALLLDFRTTTEAASAPVVLLAVVAMAETRMARAGAWLALLVFLRPMNAIVGAAAAGSLLLERRFRESLRLVLGAAPVVLAGGLLDWVTWGGPFHHLVEYVKFNWSESGANIFGVQDAWTYVSVLVSAAPLLALFVLPAAFALVRSVRPARMPMVVALCYLVAHSALGHKEPRFLVPILPLLAALVAAGLTLLVGPWLSKQVPAPRPRTLLLLAGTVSLFILGTLHARALTYADLHDPRGEPQDPILFGKRDSINRLLVEAGKRNDLCGVLILGLIPNQLFSGGTTYLNRDVLLTSAASPQLWLLMSQAANYAISASRVKPPGWRPVAVRDGVSLFTRPDGCVPLPDKYRPKYQRPRSAQPE